MITRWKVAVEAPLSHALTYGIPQELLDSPLLQRGQSVIVPLGRRQAPGVLLEPAEAVVEGKFTIRNIVSFANIENEKPTLPEHFLKWLEWLSKYYLYPIGQVVDLAFPPLARAKKDRVSTVTGSTADRPAPTLTKEQSTVVDAIAGDPGFQTHLIHGVTGSGKTEIYMRLLRQVLDRGQSGIVLVPEISLTPQLIDRFTERFGEAVAVIHSHLTPREKTNQWWAMRDGKKQILIGARSALFCPLEKLGMIVVDEEHEASFKQDEKLKYHARDAAVMLGKFAGCPVILGSATPSLETWQNAQAGRYRLHELRARVAERRLPQIEVVDLRQMRDEKKISGSSRLPHWLSERLFTSMSEALARREQVAIFLNRRGMAQAVVCPQCGWVPACPNCEVKLTLHGKSHLLCHYCDYHESLTEFCSDCKVGEPRPLGLGTESIERDLEKIFPEARLARMDRDEIESRQDLERVIKSVEDREVDILVGTQMIAKGLDFPGLTLVGLVMADVAFNLPDFRASERAFQLLTQVAGRAGRHLDEGSGQVVIQTYNPEHPSIQYTLAHDYHGFAKNELSFRKMLGYPPFGRLASLRIQGSDGEKVKKAAEHLCRQAHALRESSGFQIEILGPAPAPLARLRNQYRWHLLFKYDNAAKLNLFCRSVFEARDPSLTGVRVLIDIDAVHLL